MNLNELIARGRDDECFNLQVATSLLIEMIDNYFSAAFTPVAFHVPEILSSFLFYICTLLKQRRV